ncbi:MAG: efflux RND transporter permease subunit [Deltaproteobacteria bacterium]|nr:efflux RND transporter permease subunit [Deltaproteobacteria bacterium]
MSLQKALAKFSVTQPVLMNLLTLFLIITGLVTVRMLPREIFPEIPQGKVSITAVYPGVSPVEMENLVTMKIEREIKDIRGIDKINSISTEGLVNMIVEAEEGLDESEVSRIALDIQAAIGRIPDFPTDMDKPVVAVQKFEIPVVWIGIQSDIPDLETRSIAKDIQEELERKKGVSSVLLFGVQEPEIEVVVNPEKMKAHNLTILQVMNSLKSRQQDIPGGTIKLEKGEYLIRILGKVEKLEDFRKIIVKATNQGIIRLDQIAEVHETLKEATVIGRVDGSRSIYLGINKKSTGDSITIADDMKRFISEYNKRAPDGIALKVLFDTSKFIKRRQNTMYSNGITGLVLVVGLLFVFLSFKTAILTALGIPVAFFGTFMIMKFMGISLSMMSMFGLIVALGMIVDDAIVVVENVYRYLMKGMKPREAAIKGTSEVFWPVIGSVTTTILAFSTLTMMPGNMGKILAAIPLVVSIALGVSLIEALFVLPSHMAEWMKTPEMKQTDHAGEATGEAKWFLKLQGGYVFLLKGVTKVWPISILAFVGILVYAGWFAGTQLEFVPFPSTSIKSITVDFEIAQGSKVEKTEETVKRFEQVVKQRSIDEVESFWCTVGSVSKGHSSIVASHIANCRVNFSHDGYTKPLKPVQMIGMWRNYLQSQPDLEKFSLQIARGGPPAGNPIEIQVQGPSQDGCAEMAEKIKEFAWQLPGVTDISDDISDGKRELQVSVDQDRASFYGLDPALVGIVIRRAFAGGIASKIQRDDEDVDVVVKYPENRRRSINEIKNMEILSPTTGKMIPFRAIANIKEGRGPGRLLRVDQKRTVTVVGEIDFMKTNTTVVNKKLKELTARLEKENPQYRFVYEGESKTSDELLNSMLIALLITMGGIYIILSTILQSFAQPFIVLMAIPFGFVGVVMGMWFHNLPLSMMAMMGVVALLGVVVNDSLVMVDFINNELKKGWKAKDAVIHGGKLRLRPVILTTVTTIFGLLPMGLGIMGSEEFLQPMALAIVWGLGWSTMLTLFLVPCVYLAIHSSKRFLAWVLRIKPKDPETESVNGNQIDLPEGRD